MLARFAKPVYLLVNFCGDSDIIADALGMKVSHVTDF